MIEVINFAIRTGTNDELTSAENAGTSDDTYEYIRPNISLANQTSAEIFYYQLDDEAHFSQG